MIEPSDIILLHILVGNWLDLGVHDLVIVLEGALLVGCVEQVDPLAVLLLYLGLSQLVLVLQVVSDLLTLNTHNAHKVVGWVRQFGASVLVTKCTKVVNSEA